MDYRREWQSSPSVDHFGRRLAVFWTSAYVSSTGARPEDLVVVDPGNGFSYTFDLAGSLSGMPCAWAPRVVGVWGLSQPPPRGRDGSRMSGHPRPGRSYDDRGHLISLAAGGGYDINLVPMDASLNRGQSAEGARFRALERHAAAHPGTLFFIRPLYEDDTDRPSRFEVGVEVDAALKVEVVANVTQPPTQTPMGALRQSMAFPLDRGLVTGCLDPDDRRDALFVRGWSVGPASLTKAERNAVAGVTGHIAESVAALLLDALDWRVIWHFAGPGRHGVDLVFLTPEDRVLVVEVKGTLVAGRIPRLSRRELGQMTAEWIDKPDNPGMVELGIGSTDVFGGVITINFADLVWRMALTADFSTLHPITSLEQLDTLDWLDQSS